MMRIFMGLSRGYTAMIYTRTMINTAGPVIQVTQ